MTITGSGFLVGGAPPNHVVFGDVEAPLAAADTDTTLEATVPPGEKSGDVPVIVFNRNGESTVMGQFHYSDAPAVTSVSPAEVQFAANATVTLTGSGFSDENAGPVTVLLNGQPAVDVSVVSDTQITFTALPHDPLTTVDIAVVNTRGTGTLPHSLRFIPSSNPVLVAFSNGGRNGSNFLTIFDPTAQSTIVVPVHDTTVQHPGFRAVIQDANGQFFGAQRDNAFGVIDFDKQALIAPQPVNARIAALASLGGMVFAIDRNAGGFGTFDLASGTFTRISNIGCCNDALATDGTSLFVVVNNQISKIDRTTGALSATHTMTVNEHVGEMRFLNGQLFGTSRAGDLFTVDPATGTVNVVGNIGAASGLEVFTPGGVQ